MLFIMYIIHNFTTNIKYFVVMNKNSKLLFIEEMQEFLSAIIFKKSVLAYIKSWLVINILSEPNKGNSLSFNMKS